MSALSCAPRPRPSSLHALDQSRDEGQAGHVEVRVWLVEEQEFASWTSIRAIASRSADGSELSDPNLENGSALVAHRG